MLSSGVFLALPAAQGISGCPCVVSCVVDVPVLMRAYYLTPQDALFSIPYVWMTAMASYFSEMVKRRLDVSQGLEMLVFRLMYLQLM